MQSALALDLLQQLYAQSHEGWNTEWIEDRHGSDWNTIIQYPLAWLTKPINDAERFHREQLIYRATTTSDPKWWVVPHLSPFNAIMDYVRLHEKKTTFYFCYNTYTKAPYWHHWLVYETFSGEPMTTTNVIDTYYKETGQLCDYDCIGGRIDINTKEFYTHLWLQYDIDIFKWYQKLHVF